MEPRWTHGSKLAIGAAYYRPYWRGIQLDEVAFPVLLAWRLWKHEALGDFHPYEMVRRACGFLIREGPGIPAVRQLISEASHEQDSIERDVNHL